MRFDDFIQDSKKQVLSAYDSLAEGTITPVVLVETLLLMSIGTWLNHVISKEGIYEKIINKEYSGFCDEAMKAELVAIDKRVTDFIEKYK